MAAPGGLPKIVKCVAVGDGAVGKTSLLMVHKTGHFPQKYRPTVFDNYVTEATFEGTLYSLSLWDTAGQEDYERLRPLSYPNTHVFLLCFSLVDKASCANIASKWQPELNHYGARTPIVLVGTKADLKDETPEAQKTTTEQGKELAKTIGAFSYLECSAKTAEGVPEIFHAVMKAAIKFQTRSKKKPCTIL